MVTIVAILHTNERILSKKRKLGRNVLGIYRFTLTSVNFGSVCHFLRRVYKLHTRASKLNLPSFPSVALRIRPA